MSLPEGIALALGIYGGCLSSYVAWQQRRRDKAQLQVSGNSLLRLWPAGQMRHLVQIRATNLGLRPVEIHRAGFLEANGQERFVPFSELTPQHPAKVIEDGETALFEYDLETVFEAGDGGPDPTKVYVDDGAERRFTGPLGELHHPDRDDEQA
jgi:hypothetical protein